MGYVGSVRRGIAKILASRPWRRIADEHLVPAAVLLLLLEKEGQEHILFTERSHKVEYHKGEISFPGGKVDPGDSSLVETALREGAEEIGLSPQDVTILGRMDDIATLTTGFIVTPYVGRIPYPYPFRVNTDEIAELILAPLEGLSKDCGQEAPEVIPSENGVEAHCFRYGHHIIWGATARILQQFLDITMPSRSEEHRGIGARGSTTSKGG
ncbi:MAG: CoA pyrophosphatase [Thermodesulfobacteriota bacterium]|nr:CoA pyrophosphatase [Thermodesulfobacteriota bacterium]